MADDDEKGKLVQEGCQLGLRNGQDFTVLTNFTFEIECFVGDKKMKGARCERTCIKVFLTNGSTYPVFMERPGMDKPFHY